MTSWTPKFFKTLHGDFVQNTPDGPLVKLEGSLHGSLPPDAAECAKEDCSLRESGTCGRCERVSYKRLNALDTQVAGGHYKTKRIQPVEYIAANNLTFLEGCVVKRITRWRDKSAANRFEDLEKIKHEIDLLIEMEKRYGLP